MKRKNISTKKKSPWVFFWLTNHLVGKMPARNLVFRDLWIPGWFKSRWLHDTTSTSGISVTTSEAGEGEDIFVGGKNASWSEEENVAWHISLHKRDVWFLEEKRGKTEIKKKKTSCCFILLQTLSSKFGKKNSLFPPFFLGVETGKSSLGSRLELMEKNGDYLVTNGDLGLMGFPSWTIPEPWGS